MMTPPRVPGDLILSGDMYSHSGTGPQPPLRTERGSHAPRDGGEILVIGLGNPLLGDDGVGWHVAQAVERALRGGSEVTVDYLAVGGLGLMERLAGCRCAILIDAITTDQPPGMLYRLTLDDLPVMAAGHLHSAHDASLPVALQAGAALGVPLPERVFIVGVGIHPVFDFDDRLSPPVAACVPHAAQAVLDLLQAPDREEGGHDLP